MFLPLSRDKLKNGFPLSFARDRSAPDFSEDKEKEAPPFACTYYKLKFFML